MTKAIDLGDVKEVFWQPIDQTLDDDIFVVGYPKSGNTWMQSLIASLVYGAIPSMAPDTLIQELVPDVHWKKHYKRFGPRCYFKSHHLPRPSYKKVIYIIRDGRDVAVSFYHFLEAINKSAPDYDKIIDGTTYWECPWEKHVESWERNPYHAEILWLQYEKLKTSPLLELERIANFLGIIAEPRFLELTVQESTSQKMQDRERKVGWEGPEWPKEKLFIRRGIVGSHRDELPDEVQAKFLRQARAVMERWNYL